MLKYINTEAFRYVWLVSQIEDILFGRRLYHFEFVMATVMQKCTLHCLRVPSAFAHLCRACFCCNIHISHHVWAWEMSLMCPTSEAFGRGTAVLSCIVSNSLKSKWFVIVTRSFLQAVTNENKISLMSQLILLNSKEIKCRQSVQDVPPWKK